MKHYLDLIKISARQHRKQNRMTRLCIVLAVFLVTVIFGMADMEMRSQMIQAVKSYGNWHAAFVLDEEHGTLLKARPEVKSSVRYGVLNYRLEDGYQILGVETAVCGFDPEMMEMFPDVEILEGTLPGNAGEAVLNESAKTRFGVQVGDTVEMTIPQGDTVQYRITGIVKEMALMAEHDAFGMFLNMEGFSALLQYPESNRRYQRAVRPEAGGGAAECEGSCADVPEPGFLYDAVLFCGSGSGRACDDRRDSDDRRKHEQQHCPADRVFRDDALPGGHRQTGDPICEEGSAELVQDCNSGRCDRRHPGSLGTVRDATLFKPRLF